MRRIFELEAGTDEKDLEHRDDSDGLCESGSKTDLTSKQTEPRTNIEARVKRNAERAKIFDTKIFSNADYQGGNGLENLGRINYHEVLENIILIAQQDSRLNEYLKDVDTIELKGILINGLNPLVRAICDKGLFERQALVYLNLEPVQN